MYDPLDAALQSWSLDPWVIVPLLLTAGLYIRGWRRLRQRGAKRFGGRQLGYFLAGLATLFLALASPLETFAGLLLQVHMVQHLLLMMLAPPLLLLGEPFLPLLAGLPEEVRRYWTAPLLRQRWLLSCWHTLTALPVAWTLYIAATWLWHWPAFYEIPLRSPGWHEIEHLCFFATAVLFWWPIVQPYPSRPRGSRWALVPYLFLADVQNTVLSALIAFSGSVLYPHYEAMPRLGSLTALDDQSTAGVIMWVPGSLAFLVPLLFIGGRLLFGGITQARRAPLARRASEGHSSRTGRISLPLLESRASTPPRSPTPGFDLLRVPLLGALLRWRHARRCLQVVLLLVAGAVVLDGLLGPGVAAMNLAGVLPWIHWRGLVVLGLLTAGNVFCMGCPILLPRTVARHWWRPRWRWPRRLRSKWLAAGLLVLFFAAYEGFALWDSPWRTAWIVLGYFLAALVIDLLFEGAAFCKYVCPVGQFQMLQSTTAPLEVSVRDANVCLTCAGKECLRGSAQASGCELHLFLPRKAGNMDCTFCLDCVHACPHDNIGLHTGPRGAELWRERSRSSLGRLAQRRDLAALALVFVFAAFGNAAAMVSPVVSAAEQGALHLGLADPRWLLLPLLLVVLLPVPLLLVGMATGAGRWWSTSKEPWLALSCRFAHALVPLGCGLWLAHYSFHLFTGLDGLWPVVQRAAADTGLTGLGTPTWRSCCCASVGPWLLKLEIVFLDLGLLLSLYAGYRIALNVCPRLPQALRLFAPWAALVLLLFAAGLWILFQPMQMRGTAVP